MPAIMMMMKFVVEMVVKTELMVIENEKQVVLDKVTTLWKTNKTKEAITSEGIREKANRYRRERNADRVVGDRCLAGSLRSNKKQKVILKRSIDEAHVSGEKRETTRIFAYENEFSVTTWVTANVYQERCITEKGQERENALARDRNIASESEKYCSNERKPS